METITLHCNGCETTITVTGLVKHLDWAISAFVTKHDAAISKECWVSNV